MPISRPSRRCTYSQKKMPWNSPSVMSGCVMRYCGYCWYFSKAASQSAWFSGGSVPMIGAHSTIDSPEPVRRVTPPTTTMQNTIPISSHNHAKIARREPRMSESFIARLPGLPGCCRLCRRTRRRGRRLLVLHVIGEALDEFAVDVVRHLEGPAVEAAVQALGVRGRVGRFRIGPVLLPASAPRRWPAPLRARPRAAPGHPRRRRAPPSCRPSP